MIDTVELVRPLAALLLVVGLIFLVGWFQRRLESRRIGAGGRRARLEVVTQRALDPRTRVVLLRCDRQEHLVVVGPSGCTPLPMPGWASLRPARSAADQQPSELVGEVTPPPREPP